MKLYPNYKLFVYLIWLGLLFSCANPVAPTGGIKDEIPPVFLGSEPVNRARNFSGDKIDLVFDEFVVLKDLNSNLLISPPLNSKLDIKTKAKGVRITIDKDEVLRENTTYTIYFGNAIVDLHESNPTPNFQYVFSTGDGIDSLSIRGRVLSPEYLLPQAGVFVCLYIDNNDTLELKDQPQKMRPFYIAKTNEEGHFEINNIKNDKYLIFAVRDANANYINDMPNEEIAFLSEFVVPEEVFDFIPDSIPIDTSNKVLMDSLWGNHAVQVTKNEHNLLMYLPQDSVQKVTAKEFVNNNRMHFQFKNPLKKDAQIEVLYPTNLSNEEVFFEAYSFKKDSLDLWFYKSDRDTLRFSFQVDTLKADTFEVAFSSASNTAKPETRRNRNNKDPKIANEKATLHYKSNFKAEFPFFAKGKIEFETPIKESDFSYVKLLEDSVSVPVKLQFMDQSKRKLSVDYPWKKGMKYNFVIPDQALTDIFGVKNDSISASFTSTDDLIYGVLQMNIHLPEGSSSSWVVYLFKGSEDKETILSRKTISASGTVVFPNLVEDKYQIKILEDRDGNGVWSSGNYEKLILPEKVFYYPNAIEMKAGWNVEEDWKIDDLKQVNPTVKKETKK